MLPATIAMLMVSGANRYLVVGIQNTSETVAAISEAGLQTDCVQLWTFQNVTTPGGLLDAALGMLGDTTPPKDRKELQSLGDGCNENPDHTWIVDVRNFRLFEFTGKRAIKRDFGEPFVSLATHTSDAVRTGALLALSQGADALQKCRTTCRQFQHAAAASRGASWPI
jgi:hypothetical protein